MILKYRENKIKFQTLANMDALTNIYNRYGFDTLAERMIAKNPRNHYIAALLDVDNFKLINDVYGHAYGDRTLKNLADSMKSFFHLMYCWDEMEEMSSASLYRIVLMKRQKKS